MTLIYKLDLDLVKMNHHDEYLGQKSFRSNIIIRIYTPTHTHAHTHTHTHTHTRPTDGTTRTTKVVSNNNRVMLFRTAYRYLDCVTCVTSEYCRLPADRSIAGSHAATPAIPFTRCTWTQVCHSTAYVFLSTQVHKFLSMNFTMRKQRRKDVGVRLAELIGSSVSRKKSQTHEFGQRGTFLSQPN